MNVMKIAGLAMLGAVGALILRRLRPEMGQVLALAAGVLLLAMCMPMLGEIIRGVSALAQTGGVTDETTAPLLKVTAISLMTDFAAQTCRDAGENGLALKTELAGRILMLSLALPAMQTLLSLILSLCP